MVANIWEIYTRIEFRVYEDKPRSYTGTARACKPPCLQEIVCYERRRRREAPSPTLVDQSLTRSGVRVIQGRGILKFKLSLGYQQAVKSERSTLFPRSPTGPCVSLNTAYDRR